MQSPFLIGLLSIVPSLGLFVLKKPRKGLGVLGILFVLLILFLFTSSNFIAQLSFQFAILVYIGQIYLAVQSARTIKRQQAGELAIPREITKNEPPPGLSLKERGDYKMRETVRQQLNPGEELLEVVVAQSKFPTGSLALFGPVAMLSMRHYYVGLTEDMLVMIEQDSLGQHVDIKRLPLEDIKSSKFKKRMLYDDIVLDFGDKNILKLQVTYGLRKLTHSLYEKLQERIE